MRFGFLEMKDTKIGNPNTIIKAVVYSWTFQSEITLRTATEQFLSIQ